uniref:Uncharacterized protein n=1 Tax=Octactis speculum TaxID=3111310 RepID=A0A7S2BVU1_9STRA
MFGITNCIAVVRVGVIKCPWMIVAAISAGSSDLLACFCYRQATPTFCTIITSMVVIPIIAYNTITGDEMMAIIEPPSLCAFCAVLISAVVLYNTHGDPTENKKFERHFTPTKKRHSISIQLRGRLDRVHVQQCIQHEQHTALT